MLCGKGGEVMRIKVGAETNEWHEACGEQYLARMSEPQPGETGICAKCGEPGARRSAWGDVSVT
jgi:hypothetical protein